MRRILLLVVSAMCLFPLVPGCGGDDAQFPPDVPADAMNLDTALKSRLVRATPILAKMQSSLIFVLNPGSPLAQGVTLTPDTSAGAPPHAFLVSGSFDGDNDGFSETTLNGRAVFGSDPATGWSSVSGQMVMEIGVPLVPVFQATLDYVVNSTQATVSGSGTLTNPLTSTTTTLTVPANAPLVIKQATGAAGAVANACAHSIDGAAQVNVAAPTGTYRTTADFSSSSRSIGLHSTSFVSSGGLTSNLPDSTTSLGCGGSGVLADWVAVYDVSWACLPREQGLDRITIALNGSSALTISDSGAASGYGAQQVGSSAHAVRGFFNAGPVGNRYREDFNWSLLSNGNYTEISVYSYFEGLKTGSGGICAASGRRIS